VAQTATINSLFTFRAIARTLTATQETQMETIIASVIVSLAALVASLIRIRFSSDTHLNSHLKYQIALLILASTVLALTYVQNSTNFSLLLSIGDIAGPASPVTWFGIGQHRSWLFVGLYLSVIITMGTLTFVYLQFRQLKVSLVKVLPYIGWVVLFSLTNSFSEEAIFRLGIISPAMGTIDASYIALISAALFGLAHFGGMPYGLVGMLMAGLLGWFLAKSILETHGIFWAWSIHFIQDMVIYIGFMLNHTRQFQNEPAVESGR
jgi:membrane protease YdiL (CAAX protease family)